MLQQLQDGKRCLWSGLAIPPWLQATITASSKALKTCWILLFDHHLKWATQEHEVSSIVYMC